MSAATMRRKDTSTVAGVTAIEVSRLREAAELTITAPGPRLRYRFTRVGTKSRGESGLSERHRYAPHRAELPPDDRGKCSACSSAVPRTGTVRARTRSFGPFPPVANGGFAALKTGAIVLLTLGSTLS